MADKPTRPTDDQRAQLDALLHDYDFAVLTTISPDGSLHARPMALLARRPDGGVEFATLLDTAKARDLEANPRVGLSCFTDAAKGYVSLSGRAHISRDRAQINRLWDKSWELWAPNGPNDPDLALIRVDVEQAEYLSPGTDKLVVLKSAARALLGTPSPRPSPVVHLDESDLETQ